MIVASAVKTADGRVWSSPKPGRHGDVFDLIEKEIGEHWVAYVADREEGFLTNEGAFLDRREAFVHAKACRQIKLGDKGSAVTHPTHGDGHVLGSDGDTIHVWFGAIHVSASVPRDELSLLGPGIASEDLW